MFKALFLSIVLIYSINLLRYHLDYQLYRCELVDAPGEKWCNMYQDNRYNHGLPCPKHYHYDTVFFEYPGFDCLIYYFHGRGRTLGYNYYFLGPLFQSSKCSIIAFEYPMCRYDPASTNTGPDILLERAGKLIETVEPARRNYLMCSSMGCSILLKALEKTHILYDTRLNGLILENPPSSLSEVASFHTDYWIPAFLIQNLMGSKNDWKVSDVFEHKFYHSCKILILTSEKDEIVPSTMGYDLATRFGTTNNVTHVILDGANHGDAPSHPKYQESISLFLK